MISAALLLLCNSLFLSLHLSGSAGSFPKPLPPEKERECLERCAAGDLEARNLLVEHNLRLVAHIIKKYYTQSADQEDLISIGTIGLIKAVNTFRPDRGIKLATYASRCIENEILMYFRAQRKVQGEVSLSDALDTGAEGDALYLGDVVGDINSRRGRIDNIETRVGEQSVHSFVPLSEMFGYATDLRSRTQGRGMYTMQFDHYEEVPKSVAEKVVGKR